MRYAKKTFKTLVLLSCAVLSLASCSSSAEENKNQVEKYTVIFNPNGGERVGGGELIQRFSTSQDIVSPELSRTGYTFNSWDKDISTLNSDSVLTANWVINQYDVSYISNDSSMGSVSGKGTRFDYGSLVSLVATPNEGYVFDGWFEGENLKTAYTNYSFLMGNADVSLVAKFSKDNNVPYKVLHYKQNINDDLYSLAEVDTLYGSTNELTNAETHSYDGFVAKAFNQMLINGNGTSTVSIYYDRQKLNVSFEVNGDGSVNKSSLSVKYGTEVRKDGDTVFVGGEEVKATPKAKDGEYTYNFTNWTNASGVVTEDKVITANFSKTENIYRVTFDIGNYGMPPCFEEVGYGSKVSKPMNQTADGVTFKGWFKEKECQNAWDFDIDTIIKDTTIYAGWDLINYTISYDYPNNTYYAYSMPEGYPTSYNIETPTFDLPVLTSPKYNFKGWFTTDKCTGDPVTSIEKGSIGDKVFYTNGIGMEIKGIVTLHNVEGATDLPVTYFYVGQSYYLRTPSKDFYQFDGWYSDEAFTNKVTSVDTSAKHDVDLYAKWTELTILNITASCSYNNYRIGKKVSYIMDTAEAVVKAHLSNDTYLKLTPKYNSEITYNPAQGYQFTNADLNGKTSETKAVEVKFRGFTTSFNVTVNATEFNVNCDNMLTGSISLKYQNMQSIIYSNTSSYTFKVMMTESGSYSASYKVTFGDTVIKNTSNFTISDSYTTLSFSIDTSILEAVALANPDATADKLPTLKISIYRAN